MIEFSGINWEWTWGWLGTAVGLCLLLGYLRGRQEVAAKPRHESFFYAGLVLFLLIFLPPFFPLGAQLFTAHILQRLLLVSLVPLLLLRADPWPILWAGLPQFVQSRLASPDLSRWRQWLLTLTRPQPVWFLFVCNYLLWYDGTLHQWSLRFSWVHQAELLACFGTAALYWWHILQTAPHLHSPLPPLWRIAYAALGALPIKGTALVLLFTEKSLFGYPGQIYFSGLVLNDQSIGAILVWSLGGLVYTWTALILMRDWLATEDRKPALPESLWATDEAMAAPGLFTPRTPHS
jgi:cytochrome c oxidase assembly factor CtaG